MGLIHVQQIKSHLIDTFTNSIDLSDYSNKSEAQRESAFLTRSIAAFSLMHLANIDAKAAADAVTDGGQDNGIDAIRYNDAEKTLYVVQSKWMHDGKGGLDRGDGQKFITGFKDLINARFERFNAKVQGKRSEVEKALKAADSRFVLVIVYSGQDVLASEQQRDFDDLLEEMNDPTEVMSIRLLRQADVHGIIASGTKGSPVNLDVMLENWGLIREPFTAFYGQVAASEIAGWDIHHPRLFAPNIRMFLGSTDVNQSLVDTLRSTPERFWFFNNGITALCASINKTRQGGDSRDSGIFKCTDVTIVNGAQTVGAIASVFSQNPDSVKSARVLVRFISLENCPEDFATEVTRATNTQNRVERRDFVALDPEQDRLRTELQIEGIYYVFKSGEVVPTGKEGFDLSEATVALACSHADVGMAVQAKREIGKLWEDIAKAPYKALFNPGVHGIKLWQLVQLQREIENQLNHEHSVRSGRDAMFAIHGNRFLAYQVFKRLSQPLSNGDLTAAKQEVKTLVSTQLEASIAATNSLFADNYLASLFKNLKKCKEIDAEIDKSLPRHV
jgi:hypothetical protein